MKRYILSGVFVASFLVSLSSSAQRGQNNRRYDNNRYDNNRYDNRRYNNRYNYPTRTSVSIFASLPFGTVSVSYGDRYYHYYDGRYYRPYDRGYVMVDPPIGILVPALPAGSVAVMIGTRPYYRFGSVFYLPLSNHQYQVVQRPDEKDDAKGIAKDVAYEKVILEGKTYYKKGEKYYKASVEDNGEVSYKEIGETGK
jgi:hypothetical protein